jgi:GT2 family glycosyltransferase
VPDASPSLSAGVAVLLVSHDGARWLPAVIEGIKAQTAPLTRVVAVDTGSKDESADLLERAFGEVHRVSGATGYPEAVGVGLERLRESEPAYEWVWLLHDDANPDPGALAALLEAARQDPEADILGPKLREWPSLRRLLEVGVTITGTGRRETGLERGEYDQGQHDEVRPVLAVNTAGMLVRRRVLEELGGFDRQLPIFGNDVDFGWRAAAAGHTAIVVPDAVVFHAEAAHRGVRKTPLTGRHTHYQERRAALYTLLVNSRTWALPFQAVRLALGTVLRMIGFLVVRSVGEALDDLAALVSLYSRPGEIIAARRERRGRQTADPAVVRRLLAPPWLPYRHGLDFVGDLAAAATNQAADVAERRRLAAAERDPSSMAARRQIALDEEEEFLDTGLVARFLTNPVAVLFAAFVLVALIAARPAYGHVTGGGLSPVPESVGDWWRLHLESWHSIGLGTDVPAPPYLAPLALLGTILGATWAVSALLVLAVPLGLWGAWRFLRVVGRLVSPRGTSRWLLLWGSVSYALVPVASGAWGDGRLGTVVSAALLPWLAHAALGFADPDPERRWRAAWRAGLLLTLVAAFSPVAWVFGLVLGLVVLAAASRIVPGAIADRAVWGPPATAVGVVPVLLAPWWLPALLSGGGAALVLDVGRLPTPSVDTLDLLTGRIAGLGAPWWAGIVLVVLALAALVPSTTRIPVLVCWVVAAVAAVLAAALGSVSVSLAATDSQAGITFLVVVLQACFVTAIVIAGQRLDQLGVGRGAVAAVAGLAVVAAVVPLVGLGWWASGADESLEDAADSGIPAYMVQRAETGPEHGILVVHGDVDDGLSYTVRRGDGVTLGEDEVIALAGEDADFTSTVRRLLSRPTPALVARLADRGVEYVVLPAPADGSVAAALDATGGLVQASAENRSTRAWQVERPLDPDAVDGPRSWLRIGLLVVQALAVVTVLVLCLPTLRRKRDAT